MAAAGLRPVLDLVATVQQRGSYRSSCDALVNDLATRFACERVTLAIVVRRRPQIQAVSHTLHFDRRGDLFRAIGRAMEECLEQRGVVTHVCATKSGEKPSLLLRRHAELAGLPGSGAVCSIPLQDAAGLYGVLTLERGKHRPFDADTVLACEVACQMTGPYLNLLWRDQRWIGSKISAALRDACRKLLGAGQGGRKIALVLAVALLVFLCVAQGEYRIPARAYLEGVTVRAAVAPFDGYIGHAPRRAGDIVEAGEVLCTLDNQELQLELKRWDSEREQLTRRKQRALSEGDAAQLRVISAQLGQTDARRDLVSFHLAQTSVTAPIAGIVVSGDLSQSVGSPVQRGDLLFEVSPLDAYRVILEVDEREIAQLATGQRGGLVLASFPGEPLPFRVESITPVSVAHDGRNYFRVEGRLEDGPFTRLRPGMEGVGKIQAGERRQLWIWTHDLTDWLRVKLWSWLP